MKQESHVQLAELLGQFHCVLSTAWPKPGSPEMSGASLFIGTNLFKALENGLRDIKDLAYSASRSKSFEDIRRFADAFSELFAAVASQERTHSSQQVDHALNLLYLASGIFYHRLLWTSLSPSASEVEPFEDLLALCKWQGNSRSLLEVFNALVDEMLTITACLNASKGKS